MPQITVDHSAGLGAALDRVAFARALHTAVVEIAAAKPEACKTLFRAADLTAYGYEDPEEGRHAIVHVTVGLLAGRTDETKEKLVDAVLELLRTQVEDDGTVLHASAEIRDLDPSYRKFER
ncbi:5-carboxymethyl-2-hydroxymuconate Delta-isomerase [Streptomyces antibioticus]|uniref:5-carboxymethyl-2-hydroxymuconate Delta-isomerase n=1 Tax=Streptomyces antibioticus TaxID=1890 RepID=UPI0019604835|nr:isomerase [Streptomyces sp. S9]